ncbi:MAG: N-6 DNA methylase [Myxococcales bacterium]|nr:N-6 DNA methylase [Myxococcales bacterium]
MTRDALATALVRAEERLRAEGRTGGQAFDVLVDGIAARLGLGTASEQAARAAADLPLDTDADLLGLAYERFFADLFKGKRGQFFTPGPLVRLLVARLRIQQGETVLDPTCGSGGLLVEAARAGGAVRGLELDPRLARLARTGLAVARVRGSVGQADFFAAEPEPVDVVVANPPFSVPISDPEVLSRYALGAGKASVSSDRLFVEAIEGWVRPGGRAGLVLPWSVVVNERYADVRERLEAGWHRLAICQLPEGVFRPFGGAAGRACMLWLQRRGASDPEGATYFARLEDPGYDVRSQRLKATSADELSALIVGQGWQPLPDGAWVPEPRRVRGKRVGELASLRPRSAPTAGSAVWVADLADADRSTGEVAARPAAGSEVTSRVPLTPGDVLVARLRPNLGNVARAPEVEGALVGSPEWVVLEPAEHPGWLLHALRSPTFRASLPVTGGQTRPRTSPGAVLDSQLPWPGDRTAAAVDALSAELFAERAALRRRLLGLQEAVDAFLDGRIDAEQLAVQVAALSRG